MVIIRKYCGFMLFLMLMVTLSPELKGQVITAKALIENDSALIGDPLVMIIRIEKPEGMLTSLPDYTEMFPGSIELTSAPEADSVSHEDSQAIDYSFQFAAFDTGIIEIPPVKVAFMSAGAWDTIETLPVLLNIASVPLDADIHDIKGNYAASVTLAELAPFIAAIAGFAAIIAAALWYFKRRLSKMPVQAENQFHEPPDVTAINDLIALQKEEPWRYNRVKENYTRLTEILRIYIERKFAIAALERTTDEIVSSMRQTPCEPSVIKQLESILNVADLAKFAKSFLMRMKMQLRLKKRLIL
jgi:hypothetical protein